MVELGLDTHPSASSCHHTAKFQEVIVTMEVSY